MRPICPAWSHTGHPTPHRGFWWGIKWLLITGLINIALLFIPWMIGSLIMYGHF
jgi:hypothetical protein